MQDDIFKSLENLRKKFLTKKTKISQLYSERTTEVEKAKETIVSTYQEKIDRIENQTILAKKELNDCDKLLAKYSTFDVSMISKILEQLVSLIEGQEYSFQDSIHKTFKSETTPLGSETFAVTNRVLLIAQGKSKKEYFQSFSRHPHDNVIFNLVDSGKAILLREEEMIGHSPKNIAFYEADNGIITCFVNFGKFTYVKEFIDSLIQYKFQNDLEEITEKELLTFMSEFISSHKDLIISKQQLRIKEQQEQLEKELEQKQEEYNRFMEARELENLRQNKVPSRYSNLLIERLNEASIDTSFNKALKEFDITYETEEETATIKYDDTITSTENLFIAKINISSSIKNYFDNSDSDRHFHGFVDIDLIDDGLIGIVDVSNSSNISESSLNNYGLSCPFASEVCKIDKIGDNYLRVLFLPNKGHYRHQPINYYAQIAQLVAKEFNSDNKTENNTPVSYKTQWDVTSEADKMIAYAKEIEILSYLNDKQLKLYKQRTSNKQNQF